MAARETTTPEPEATSAAPTASRSNMLPLRGDSALPVPGLENCGDVILLSFFDGIGSASLALSSLGVRVRATMEWEVEPVRNRSVLQGVPWPSHETGQPAP